MTHFQVEPTIRDITPPLSCPGVLRPDPFRHRRNQPIRAWRCSICRQRFIWVNGQILVGCAVGPKTQQRLIEESRK